MRWTGFKRWPACLLSATVMLFTTTGCGPSASPPPAGLSDLCSALPIADVQSTYRRLTPQMWVTKRLDTSKFHKAGMASCHYGPKDDPGGVTLSIPLGAPVPEIAALVGDSRARNGQQVTVGSDNAYFLVSKSESTIVVAHGSTQFVLSWTPLLGAAGERVTQPQLINLASTVANKMPANFSVPQQDIAPECGVVQAAEQIVGGQVLMARGSANADTLNCHYLGSTGILRASATREPGPFVSDRIRILRTSPQNLVDPPVADDTALMVLSRTGMYLQGYLTDCCAVEFDYRAINDTTDYCSEFDAAQRQFVTTFITAARNWSRRH